MKNAYTSFLILLVVCINTPNLTASERYPLEAPETTSPRTTLRSFQTITQDAKPIVDKIRTSGFSGKITRNLRDLGLQAMRCLDLSQVPKRLQDDVGPESVVLLAEILARIELPPYQAIPDADAMESKEISRWRIPHTEITISQVKEGPRKGEYLFTPETVASLKEFFYKIRELPYRPDSAIKKLGSAGGLYEYYSSSPRGIVPIHLIEILPSWARALYFDHAVWQWISMMLTLMTGFLVMILIYLLTRWRTKDRDKAGKGRGFISLILPLSSAIIVLLAGYIVDEHIGMTGKAYQITEILIWALFLIFVMWCIVAFGRFVGDAIVASPTIDPKGIYAGLTKVVCYLIALAIAATIFFKGLSDLGISLIPLITGLGVGGLAVALAARPTIENLIGGLMILADRPCRAGQRVKVKGNEGIVQQIGMRSTKIRLLSGSQITIPNEEMARAEIENVTRRQYIRRDTNITVTYDTPPEKVEMAVQIIRDILDDHEGMHPKRPPRVYFTEFNPDSLNIFMRYWYHPAKRWEARAFAQKVNLKIMEEFKNEGIKFAFPTLTTYLAQEENQPLHFTPFKGSSFSDGGENKTG